MKPTNREKRENFEIGYGIVFFLLLVGIEVWMLVLTDDFFWLTASPPWFWKIVQYLFMCAVLAYVFIRSAWSTVVGDDIVVHRMFGKPTHISHASVIAVAKITRRILRVKHENGASILFDSLGEIRDKYN